MLTTTPNIRSVVDHDGAVLLDIPRNAMTTLNSTGAYVWERLNRGMSVAAVVAELSKDTGVDEAIVGADVEVFLEELKSRHLMKAS
jgi:hypothetical protein